MKRREFLNHGLKAALSLWLGKDLVGLVSEASAKPLPDIDPLLNYNHNKVPTLTSEDLRIQTNSIKHYEKFTDAHIKKEMWDRSDDWAGYHVLGARAYNRGDLKTAEKNQRLAIRDNNKSWNSWNELGMTLCHRGKMDLGIYHCEVAHALAPNVSDPLVNLATYNVWSIKKGLGGSYSKTEKLLSKALSVNPNDSEARRKFSVYSRAGLID